MCAQRTCVVKSHLNNNFLGYCKIPKISPGAYIFHRPFLRGLYLQGLMYRRKFAFHNRLG